MGDRSAAGDARNMAPVASGSRARFGTGRSSASRSPCASALISDGFRGGKEAAEFCKFVRQLYAPPCETVEFYHCLRVQLLIRLRSRRLAQSLSPCCCSGLSRYGGSKPPLSPKRRRLRPGAASASASSVVLTSNAARSCARRVMVRRVIQNDGPIFLDGKALWNPTSDPDVRRLKTARARARDLPKLAVTPRENLKSPESPLENTCGLKTFGFYGSLLDSRPRLRYASCLRLDFAPLVLERADECAMV